MRETSLSRRALVLAGLAVLAGGCQRAENRHLSRAVDRQELVGDWVATESGTDALQHAGYRTHLDPKEHRLALRGDGTCEAETVVDPASPGPDGTGLWVSKYLPCAWDLGKDGDHQTLELWVQMVPGKPDLLKFYFDEEEGHIVLWQYAGDPDARKYMEFRRSGEAG